ncbi:MAG: GYF domain-containing protein [Clostridia bacterium]|nr:GYF domain-containing protein [Clostridia bacterium]
MQDLIYIYHNNQQEGPYAPEQLLNMIAEGTLTPVTLAWKEGMSDWAPLHIVMSCKVLKQATQMPPPPSIDQQITQLKVPTPSAATTGLKGVGGWLLFFCVGLTILGPLLSLGQITMDWVKAKPLFFYFPNAKIAIMFESIGLMALLIYGFIAGCMIWGGNARGREIAKRYLLIRLVGFIGVELICVMIMWDLVSQNVTLVIDAMVKPVFREVGFFLIWWFYFKKSKRVRNTYGAI